MNEKVEITGCDLIKLVQRVYDLSQPQGMGFLHFQPGPLSDEDAKELVEAPKHGSGRFPIALDYVKGRACKFSVEQKDGRLFMYGPWYDHTPTQFEILKKEFACGVNSSSSA